MNTPDTRRSFGTQGEQQVVHYLIKQGFSIHAQNYRKFFGEIDIIAYKKQLYIFVEVKSRQATTIAMGELVSISKQIKIIKTAQTFLAEEKICNVTCRFDVALVYKKDGLFSIEYIQNAFTQSQEKYSNYYGY